MAVLKKHYPLSEDREGRLYCGIELDWRYDERRVIFGMPGYVKKALAKYVHESPSQPQHSPLLIAPKKYKAVAQDPLPPDELPAVGEKEKTRIQQVAGTLLYYVRAVNLTILPALSTIASKQASPTEQTVRRVKHLLNYLSTHPKARMCFRALDMVMNVHSDASYFLERGGQSRAAGHFFLGWSPWDGAPIWLNGAFFTLSAILRFVTASAAEAELGALFLNMREGRIFRLMLKELGHPQPAMPVHCDSETAAGIVNGTV